MLSLGVSAGLPVLVTGPPVCGKSSLIQRFGRRLSKATLAGPDPAYTPRIGDVCKEEDVLAVVRS